jgi:hypothetical protein
MAPTITSPRILHAGQGFNLHALSDHHPFDGAGVDQGKRRLTRHWDRHLTTAPCKGDAAVDAEVARVQGGAGVVGGEGEPAR